MDPLDAPHLNQPLIISAALTGSWPTKEQNPNLPVTEQEIAQAADRGGRRGSGHRSPAYAEPRRQSNLRSRSLRQVPGPDSRPLDAT